MGRSKKNWDHLVDFRGNYKDVNAGNIGVAQIIAGFGIKVDPSDGVGTVEVEIDRGIVMSKGDNVGDLNNNVGYIKGVEYLNDIGNVTSVPSSGDVLTYDGSINKWVAGSAPVPDAFKFKGLIDVEDEFPFADPKAGDFHIQRNAGVDRVANNAWVGAAGDIANVGDVIMYNTFDKWEIVANGFDFAFLPDDIKVVDMGVDGDKGEKGGRLEYESTSTTFYNWRADFSHLPDLDDETHQTNTLDDRYVNANGDTMTGDLTLTGANIKFTTPGQIDTDGQYLNLRNQGTNSIELFDTTTNFVNRDVRFLAKGRQVGLELLSAPAAADMELLFHGLIDDDKSLITREYYDLTLEAELLKYLPLTGGVMSGPITFSQSLGTITFNDTGHIKFGNQMLLGDNILVSKYTSTFFSDVQFMDSDGDNFLEVRGSGNKGEVNYTGPVEDAKHIATKEYVDAADDVVKGLLANLDNSIQSDLDNYFTKGESDARFLQDIEVNSTATGAPGTDAEVTVFDFNKFDFVIPQGEKGEVGPPGQNGSNGSNGQSCTVDAGTATVVGSNSPPEVTNVGTTKDAIFNFKIPQGQKGNVGQTGATGATGQKGATGSKGNTGAKGQKGASGSGGGSGYVINGSSSSYKITISYSNGSFFLSTSSP